jgi:ComF family protein
MMRLDFNPLTGCCRRCSRPVEGFEGDYLCEECRAHPPAFDRSVAALAFEFEARRMILDFKFRQHTYLASDFADWLEAVARARLPAEKIDLVAPVPMLFIRRLLRGYNQCDILASDLAKRLGKPFCGRLLRRIGSPRRQSELGEAERRENVKGTFSVGRGRDISGRTVLLVDDVITTGSTLSECARVLKAAGARRVFCAALASTQR